VQHAIWWQVYPLGFAGAPMQAGPADGPPVHRLRRLLNWLDYAIELGASGLALGPVFASETHGYDTVDHHRIDPRLGDDADFDALVAAAHERGLKVLLDGVFNHVGPGFPHREWLSGGTFEGHAGLRALDHAQPAVVDHVVDVCDHWLRRGADGWRMDAAYAVPRAFWAQVVPRVKAEHPDAYLVGEVIHGDYAGFVAETGLDSVTQYELWKAIWSSLNDRNLFELSWALERHAALLEAFAPLTFVGNHDVTRIASRLTDERHLAHALVLLFTLGGTPSVYAGDEQAFRGIKEERAGGDDEIRPEFPDTPDGLAPHGWPTYRLHQRLIGLRRRHPWLHRARPTVLELANQHARIEVRDGDRALVVALNLADEPVALPGADRVLDGAGVEGNSLAPHGWAVLSG
jgi:cyclomaltodextrinase / maltogenic alpha-amylase / neopullulanase